MKDIKNEITKGMYILYNNKIHKIKDFNANKDTIINEDNSFITKSKYKDISIIKDVFVNDEIKINDKLILKKSYNSLKLGTNIIVKDFLDDKRIITDNIVPGGWIDLKDLRKEINIKTLRFKTYLECCKDWGILWQQTFNPLGKYDFLLKGESLHLHNILCSSFEDCFLYGVIKIPGIFTTLLTNPIKEYDIKFISKEKLFNINHEFAKKNLKYVNKYFKDLDFEHKSLVDWVKCFNYDKFITNSKNVLMSSSMFELVEI